ncbi:MAG: chemotaxis response regulator protein-glutamate methylesterase [Clostridia bacterium]|nr:chemotaxis response regulator protein-glutamate methylesterase [Clostridia bacterium]
MRKKITNILTADNQLEVVATARNGQEGVELCRELKPDVVTMDIEMPVMDGLTALEQIMEKDPVPVVMLSSLTSEGADATMKALDIGAVDFICKPSGAISLDLGKIEEEIVLKVKTAAQAKVRAGRPVRLQPNLPKLTSPVTQEVKKLNKILAIGTSTGGPKALQEIIPLLPRSIPAGIVIVQHMPKGFTKSLADRLDSLSQIAVREAQDGDEVVPGLALIAPGDYHMELQQMGAKTVVRLNQEPPVGGHRPCVDVMMKSVVKIGLTTIGVILTGMGQDGVEGMELIKKSGGQTIAQDQETCIVFGMPKVAIERNCINKIVPLPKIALEIMKML